MRAGVLLAVVALVAIAAAIRPGGHARPHVVPGPLAAGGAGSTRAAGSAQAPLMRRVGGTTVRMVRVRGPQRRPTLARASHPFRIRVGEPEAKQVPAIRSKPIAPSVAYRLSPAGAPTVGAKITGLNSTQGQADPPDVQTAAGPTTFVEMVNTVYAMWSRAGVLLDSGNLDEFFTSSGVNRQGDEVTDPRVLYDTRTGRWFTALFDVTRAEALVGVSDTSDPTADWKLVAFDFDPSLGGTCPDQPRLGISDDVVVVGVDLFENCEAGTLKGGVAIVFDKQEMLAGGPVTIGAYGGRSTALTQITPAISLGPTGPDYLVSIQRDKPGTAFLYTATDPDAPTLNFVSVKIAPMDPPPNAPQKGTSVRLDTGDDRVQNARWENGVLTFVASDACRPAAVVVACARLAQISTVTSKLVFQKELVLAGGRYLFYPVLESDGAGNLLLAFGYSSGTEFPGVGAIAFQPDRSFSSWTIVQAGTGSHHYGGKFDIPRYGDYFGIARDPVVPNQVWAAAEYGNGLQRNRGWGTTVFAMTAGSANPPPPPPPHKARPTVKPKPATVRARRSTKLRFTVHDNAGHALVAAGVYRGSRNVKNFGSQELANGAWFFKWTAPAARGRLRFCLQATDAAGNKSKTACAAVRVT